MDKEKKKSSFKAIDFRKEPKFLSLFKFHNELPMVPSEQKFLAYPFEAERFCEYTTTSLESNYIPGLLLPLDLGITVDLVNPDIYTPQPADLDPEDVELLLKDSDIERDARANKYSTSTSLYLRKSTLPAGPIVYAAKEASHTEEDAPNHFDPEVLIPKIESTFEKTPLVHPTKPHLKPAKVFEVLPEQKYIHTEFVVFAFDEELGEEPMKVLQEEDADEEVLLAYYATAEDGMLPFQRNYRFSYFNEPNQNDIIMWVDEDTETATYALVENKIKLKKNIQKSSQQTEFHTDLMFQPRGYKKSELLARKEILQNFEFDIDSSMDSDRLEAMEEHKGEENVEKVLLSLFGEDDDDEEEEENTY